MHTQLNVTRHNEDFGLARTKQQFDTCPDVITMHLHRHSVSPITASNTNTHSKQTPFTCMSINK